MPARRLTENEKAIWLAIESNRKTIKQLELANRHLLGVLPKIPFVNQGVVTDPRTGGDEEYQKTNEKKEKP